MEIDRREIARYLGYKGTRPDAEVQELIEASLKDLQMAAVPRSLWHEFPLRLGPGNLIDLGCLRTNSRNLARNLSGCGEVVLFAATLGSGVDTLIHRASITGITKGVILQAAAAAMIEAWCDENQEQIRIQMEARGLFLRPRFSPGYGDLPLECQRDIVRVLKTAKEIGLTLTESCLMTPVKSVTAFIGVSPLNTNCHQQGCEACLKKDCQFRRN